MYIKIDETGFSYEKETRIATELATGKCFMLETLVKNFQLPEGELEQEIQQAQKINWASHKRPQLKYVVAV